MFRVLSASARKAELIGRSRRRRCRWLRCYRMMRPRDVNCERVKFRNKQHLNVLRFPKQKARRAWQSGLLGTRSSALQSHEACHVVRQFGEPITA
jgi:hypothetical protein